LFGVRVPSPNEGKGDIIADAYLHTITFTEDTFWYPWNGTAYVYSDPSVNTHWFWKFKYILSPGNRAKVIAWVKEQRTWPDAFIIENMYEKGYTYIINTRNPSSLPNGVFTDVLYDFINRLCSYYVKPTLGLIYPSYECWLAHGQAGRVIYLIHDNSTVAHTFEYNVSSSSAKEYALFDWISEESLGVRKGRWLKVTVTLRSNASKLIYLKEYVGRPEVLYASFPLTRTSSDRALLFGRLMISANGSVSEGGTVQIYTGGLRPRYVKVNGIRIFTWTYDDAADILTINHTTSNEVFIEVIFGLRDEERFLFWLGYVGLGLVPLLAYSLITRKSRRFNKSEA